MNIDWKEWRKEAQNGIVLQDNSSDSICNAILEIIGKKNLKNQGKISREIVQKFNWKEIAESAIEQYEQILGKEKCHYEANWYLQCAY